MFLRDKNFSRIVIAAVALLGGYADLVRGGITISAILLALAYCVFIPMALLGPRDGDGSVPRTPWIPALVAGAAVILLYGLTLAPSTAMWDASEYIAAAWTFGLPHPPGNPMFVILGRAFSLLPIAPSVAMRINVLAAVASGVAAATWFLIASRAVRPWTTARWQQWVVGGLAALVSATAFTVWNQSVVNEKVYTVSLAGMAIISWCMLRWSEAPDTPRADRLLLVVAYVAGLGYANHMAGMLPVPAAAVVVLMRRPGTLLRWRLVLACLGVGVLGLTPFATQPIRSAHQPALNEGEPTACRNGFAWSCTLSDGTWDAFAYNLNREQYGKPDLSLRQAPFGAQIGMWWLYFKWQWFRDAGESNSALQHTLALLFLALGFLGAREQYRYDRRGFAYTAPLIATLTIVLIYYLNFKYGASQDPQLGDVPREVRDRDYFYLWSYSAWGLWAALGLAGIWRMLAGLGQESPKAALPSGAGTRRPERDSGPGVVAFPRRLLLTAPVLAVGFIPLGLNWKDASRAGDQTTIAFARDLLNSVEPYGVLITGGDNDTFPLWYAQEVEGVRQDVTVGVLSLMNTDWFARGLARRPTRPYDPAKGPAVYRERQWPMPKHPPLNMSLGEVDSLPEVQPVQERVRFQFKEIDADIDPKRLLSIQGIPILERADLIMFRMIADSWPERPIYISRTTGDYAERMGLAPFVMSQGLARKVVPPPSPGPDIVPIAGSGWFDVARSKALWDQFEGPQALIDFGKWVDRPSVSTAFSYLMAGSELAEALRWKGDTAAARVWSQVERTARAVGLQQYLRAAPDSVLQGDTGARPAVPSKE